MKTDLDTLIKLKYGDVLVNPRAYIEVITDQTINDIYVILGANTETPVLEKRQTLISYLEAYNEIGQVSRTVVRLVRKYENSQ